MEPNLIHPHPLKTPTTNEIKEKQKEKVAAKHL